MAFAVLLPFAFGLVIHRSLSWLAFIASVVFLCMLSAAIPTAVVERRGILGAVERSFVLTRGRLRTIFLVAATLSALQILTVLLFGYAVWAPDDGSDLTASLAFVVLGVFARSVDSP